MQKLHELLARFQAVREVGPNKWRAKRPGSDDFNVAIALADNGGILLHDFSGRTAAELLAEIGMTLADLAPPDRQTIDRPQTPQERRDNRQRMALASVQAAAKALDTSATIAQAAVAKLEAGERLDADERDQLSAAHDQIVAARQILQAEVRA